MVNLSDNAYNASAARSEPKLKLWRNAGLLLTYRCNASCGFCYYSCSPEKDGLMPVDNAIDVWRSLRTLAGDSAKIHVTGGEPFLYWDRLIEILSAAMEQGLGPADLVETNGCWADNKNTALDRLKVLDELKVKRLKVACDPFHQQYVDIETVRRLVEIATAVLGPDRVQVRWRRYLELKPSPSDVSAAGTDRLYRRAMADYPCRFTGRAAGRPAALVAEKTVADISRENCRRDFLAAKGVHVDPYGNVFSSTCSGIIIANVNDMPLDEIWRSFDPSKQPFIKTLFAHGPAGLIAEAAERGYRPPAALADKCHLCTDVRRFFSENGLNTGTVGPADCY